MLFCMYWCCLSFLTVCSFITLLMISSSVPPLAGLFLWHLLFYISKKISLFILSLILLQTVPDPIRIDSYLSLYSYFPRVFIYYTLYYFARFIIVSAAHIKWFTLLHQFYFPSIVTLHHERTVLSIDRLNICIVCC